MMMSLDKIDEDVVERLTSRTFFGFVLIPNLRFVNQLCSIEYNVHIGEIIPPEDTNARERETRYLVRSCVSLEKMADESYTYCNTSVFT